MMVFGWIKFNTHSKQTVGRGRSLDFAKALEAALLMENAECNVKSLHTDSFR